LSLEDNIVSGNSDVDVALANKRGYIGGRKEDARIEG